MKRNKSYISKIDDWKTFEKNNSAIALNILYIKEKDICPAYISKNDWNCGKQIILLIISNEEEKGWYYLAVKKLSTLLRGITSRHHGDFYCFKCVYSCRIFQKSAKINASC